MQIRVTEIPPDGRKTYEGEAAPAVLSLDSGDPFVKADRPVRFRVAASLAGGRLIVQGQMWTEALFRCSRCAEYFRLAIRDDAFERVIELPPDALSVDLTEDIRETILLRLSGYPVCRADCKGLCVRCGANLNRETCCCKPPDDGQWGALDQLKLPVKPG
ncbi:MAG: DUF177 domain-containing protein [Verrucomicrobiota bacterium]|nr:DUF177 domain-containing protein [Verrucomicrobiota bacterium]